MANNEVACLEDMEHLLSSKEIVAAYPPSTFSRTAEQSHQVLWTELLALPIELQMIALDVVVCNDAERKQATLKQKRDSAERASRSYANKCNRLILSNEDDVQTNIKPDCSAGMKPCDLSRFLNLPDMQSCHFS